MPRGWASANTRATRGNGYGSVPPVLGEARLRTEVFALLWGHMNLMTDPYSFGFEHTLARSGMEATEIADGMLTPLIDKVYSPMEGYIETWRNLAKRL